jgi:hypothetical protein
MAADEIERLRAALAEQNDLVAGEREAILELIEAERTTTALIACKTLPPGSEREAIRASMDSVKVPTAF